MATPTSVRSAFGDKKVFTPLEDLQAQSRKFEQDISLNDPKHTSLRDELAIVTARLTKLEEERAKAQAEAEATKQTMQEFKDDLRGHKSTLTNIFEHMHMLESVALDYRPSAVAIVFRRQLDDARFCLAEGFMTVFPRSFARWLVLNEFDRTRKTAEWYKFKNCLWTHLNNHLTYDQSERLRYQQESLFKDCSRDVLLLAGKPTGPRREEVSMDVPNSHLFNEPILLDLKKATEVEVTTGEAVAPMYEEGVVAAEDTAEEDTAAVKEIPVEEPTSKVMHAFDVNEPTDCELHLQLQAYIPVFIWAFNCLKFAILEDDKKLSDLEAEWCNQHAAFEELHGVPPKAPSNASIEPKDTSSPFALGTAADQRKSTTWQAFFELTKKKESKAKPSRAVDTNVRGGGGTSQKDVKRKKLNSQGPGGNGKGGDRKNMPSTSMGVDSSHATVTKVQTDASNQGAPALSPKNNRIMIKNMAPILSRLAEKLYFLKKRRQHRIYRYNAIMKCLSILLDTKLLNFAVYGESFVRRVACYFIHKNNKYGELVKDALGRVPELIEAYKQDREAIREAERRRLVGEEGVSEWLTLGGNKRKYEDADQEDDNFSDDPYYDMYNSEDFDRDEEDEVLEGFFTDTDVAGTVERLRKLIYDSDGYYNSQDFTLEIAVDDHLQDAQENLGVLSDWDVKLTDHQILMVWLDSFAAKV